MLIHKPGEFIPLPWSLGEVHVPGLYYDAISKVTILRTTRNNLRDAMVRDASLFQEIMMQTINIMSVYSNRIQILEYHTARERMVAQLIYLARRFGEKKGNQVFIKVPVTHQDIADSINTTRETAVGH